MKNKNSCKLWCVLLAMALVLSSSMMLGVSAQETLDDSTESTQPVEPSEPGDAYDTPEGAAPDNEGNDPEGGNNSAVPDNEGNDAEGDVDDTLREPEMDATGLVYMLNAEGTEYSVMGYMGTAAEVIIPATYNDLPVTSLGDCVLLGCSHLTSITVPAGVTKVGEYALAECDSLTSVTFEGVLEYVDSYAFSNASEDCTISFAQNAPVLSWDTEWNTDCFATIVWGDLEWVPVYSSEGLIYELNAGKTEYSVTGYEGFSSLVEIPATYNGLPVTSIADNAFWYCTDLVEIMIPDSVISIGQEAFFSCHNLTEVTIPDSVTSIGSGAFSYCENLMSITFESSYTEIYDCVDTISDTAVIYGYEGSTAQAYAEKYGRELVVLEESQPEPEQPDPTKGTEGLIYTLNAAGTQYRVTGYEGTAVHVVIPETYAGLPVTRVVYNAFSDDGSIELPPDIVRPLGVVSAPMVVAAATSDVKLQSITLLSPTVILEDDENTIPTGVAIYGYLNSTAQKYADEYNRMFTAMDGLEFSFVPEQGAYVLNSYTGNQTEVTIPAIYLGLPVIGIGDYAFEDLAELTEVILPDSIIYIGEGAFLQTGLIDFTLPKNVIYIGLGALCSEVMASLNVALGNPAYYSTQNCIIEIATGTLVAGCKDSVIPDDGSVTVIGDGAFAYSSVTSVVIPDFVTEIGSVAFYECTELESVTFGTDSQLTLLGESAFDGCCSLSNIVLPAGLVEIGDYAFYCCCSLIEITIGDTVERIGEYAFDECTGLTKIIIRSDDVDIFNDEYTFPEAAVICGHEGSTAQMYAEQYDRVFEQLILAFIPGDVDGVNGVRSDDAIYLLYNIIFGDDDYPINQPCDFNGDGDVNSNDAIYLLYYVIFGGDLYPLH